MSGRVSIFTLSIAAKALNGLIETAGGVILFLLPPLNLFRILETVNQALSLISPHAQIALAPGGQNFGVIYLVSHGLIKLALAVGLLKRVSWVFPLALTALAIMIAYQTYRIYKFHSLPLTVFTAIDLGILVIIVAEFKRIRRAAT